MTKLAILYEHPTWFEPLFAALDRHGIDYQTVSPGSAYDPADSAVPAPLILNRIAMSTFLREAVHPIFWAQSLLARLEAAGAYVLNGTRALGMDTSKARQLALISPTGPGHSGHPIGHRRATTAKRLVISQKMRRNAALGSTITQRIIGLAHLICMQAIASPAPMHNKYGPALSPAR